MKTLLLSGAIVLAVPSAALSAAFEPERVEEAATFDDLRAVVKALGHEVEAEDPRNQTLRAADANGTHYLLTGTACDVEGVPSNVIIRISGRHHPQKGETLHVTTDPEHVHVFDTESGERLSD